MQTMTAEPGFGPLLRSTSSNVNALGVTSTGRLCNASTFTRTETDDDGRGWSQVLGLCGRCGFLHQVRLDSDCGCFGFFLIYNVRLSA